MIVRHYEMRVATSSDTDMLDITDAVAERVRESGIAEGQVLVHVPGSTGSITTIEYEPGVLADLARAIDRLAPRDETYDHDRRWGDGNGYAHVRAALFGPGRAFPVHEARVVLGRWQQIILLDFDNRPRERRVTIQIMGAPIL